MASECFMELLRGADGGMPVDAFDTDWSVPLYAAPLTDIAVVAVRILLHLVETTEEKRLEVRFACCAKMQAVRQRAGGIAHD